MEISTFSDMLLVEPYVDKSNKKYMPHKKIGFFDDKMLFKTIGDLKSNLQKKKNLINNYNPVNIIKKRTINSEFNNTYQVENSHEREFNYVQSKLNSEERKVKILKMKLNLIDSKNKNQKAISLKKQNSNSIKIDNVNATTNSSFTKNNNNNLNSEYNTKNIQLIKSNYTNIVELQDRTKKSENKNNNKRSKSKANFIKNQIILGKLNKETRYKNIIQELSSIKNNLNSELFTPKIEDSEKKSKLEINLHNRKSSAEFDQESVGFYNNKLINLAKFNASIRNKQDEDLKIDFIYKKIFDKKTRCLFSNTEDEDNSSQVKKKLKTQLEQENEYLKSIGKLKKKQYIEDKIQDIKRKIFFVKGVYDFSYPQIIVSKIKTAQDFYNHSHTEEKAKLRESLNHTSKKFFSNKKEKLKLKTEELTKSFNIEKIDAVYTNHNTDKFENENKLYPEIERKMLRTSSSFDFKQFKNAGLTLTNKFIYPEDIYKVRVITPLNIQNVHPDLGEPSKLKVIHKSKIF